MKWIIPFFLLLSFPLTAESVHTRDKKDIQELFREAVDSGEGFEHILELYAAQLDKTDMPSAEVYYNMANTLVLSDQIIPAMALYTEALFLKPGDREIRTNRNRLYQELEIQEDSPLFPYVLIYWPVYLFGLYGSWFVLFTVLFILICWQLVNIFRKKTVRPEWKKTAVLCALLLYFPLLLGLWEQRSSRIRIVQKEEVELRIGDNPLYASTAAVKRGEAVRILENRSSWLRVRTLNGKKEGWLEAYVLLEGQDIIDSY